MTSEPTVFVVDDEKSIRLFLSDLITSEGFRVEAHDTAHAFLNAFDPDRLGCLVLDVRMPGMSGLELQIELRARRIDLPIILLTGHGDVPMAVKAIKMGAFEFIEKPFDNRVLLNGIRNALGQAKDSSTSSAEVAHRMDSLTPRERQVLELVVAGETNKGIARRLGISDKTIEIHRRRVMRKMQVKSLAHLVKEVTLLEARSSVFP